MFQPAHLLNGGITARELAILPVEIIMNSAMNQIIEFAKLAIQTASHALQHQSHAPVVILLII